MDLGKIAIIGSGSIGLFYGGKLSAAGHDVRFLLRSGLQEAAQRGITIKSESGDIILSSPRGFSSTHEMGPCDLVIIGLKTTANPSLESHIPPLLSPATALLTLQNGLGNEEFLAGRFGAERVMGGLCFVCLNRESPASVIHMGHGALSIGEYLGAPRPRTREIVAAFQQAGIETKLATNLKFERWRKLVWNVPFNGLCVAEGGITVDQVLAVPVLYAKCRGLMLEVLAAAEAYGCRISPEYVDFQIEQTLTMGAYKPSTLIDFLDGKEFEIEAIWGEPLRLARQAGVRTPHLEQLHAQLLRKASENWQPRHASP